MSEYVTNEEHAKFRAPNEMRFAPGVEGAPVVNAQNLQELAAAKIQVSTDYLRQHYSAEEVDAYLAALGFGKKQEVVQAEAPVLAHPEAGYWGDRADKVKRQYYARDSYGFGYEGVVGESARYNTGTVRPYEGMATVQLYQQDR